MRAGGRLPQRADRPGRGAACRRALDAARRPRRAGPAAARGGAGRRRACRDRAADRPSRRRQVDRRRPPLSCRPGALDQIETAALLDPTTGGPIAVPRPATRRPRRLPSLRRRLRLPTEPHGRRLQLVERRLERRDFLARKAVEQRRLHRQRRGCDAGIEQAPRVTEREQLRALVVGCGARSITPRATSARTARLTVILSITVCPTIASWVSGVPSPSTAMTRHCGMSA